MIIYKASKDRYDVEAVNVIFDKLKLLQEQKDKITVALSGGSTPIPILKSLATKKLNWKKFSFFLVDERCVSVKNPQSNFGNIKSVFFDRIHSEVYPMFQDNISIEDSIQLYEEKIRHKVIFRNELPAFDLILLGMGEDGHTASLFPSTKALNEQKKMVIKNHIPQLNSDRITLTYPVILNAENIFIMIKGNKKKIIFDEIYSSKNLDYPIARIMLSRDDINWIIENT